MKWENEREHQNDGCCTGSNVIENKICFEILQKFVGESQLYSALLNLYQFYIKRISTPTNLFDSFDELGVVGEKVCLSLQFSQMRRCGGRKCPAAIEDQSALVHQGPQAAPELGKLGLSNFVGELLI